MQQRRPPLGEGNPKQPREATQPRTRPSSATSLQDRADSLGPSAHREASSHQHRPRAALPHPAGREAVPSPWMAAPLSSGPGHHPSLRHPAQTPSVETHLHPLSPWPWQPGGCEQAPGCSPLPCRFSAVPPTMGEGLTRTSKPTATTPVRTGLGYNPPQSSGGTRFPPHSPRHSRTEATRREKSLLSTHVAFAAAVPGRHAPSRAAPPRAVRGGPLPPPGVGLSRLSRLAGWAQPP